MRPSCTRPLTTALTCENTTVERRVERGRRRCRGQSTAGRPSRRMAEWRRGGFARSGRGTGSTPELPGVDLLRARYVRKTFVRHTHEDFVIAAVTDGVEVFQPRRRRSYAGAGSARPDQPRHPAHRARRRARGLAVRRRVPVARAWSPRSPPRPTTLRGTPGLRPPGARRPVRRRARPPGAPGRRGGQRAGRRHAAAGRRDPAAAAATAGRCRSGTVRTRGRPDRRTRACRAGGADGRAADAGAARRRSRHQPVRAAAGLPGRVRDAAAHLAHRRPGAPGAPAAGRRDRARPRRPSPSASPTSRT